MTRPALALMMTALLCYVVCTAAVVKADDDKDQLHAHRLEVGQRGKTDRITGKTVEVIDEKSVVVGIDDDRTNNGKYATLVLVKCDTKGLVDGKFLDSGILRKLTKSEVVEVTGTHRYKMKDRNRTIFVIEAAKK